MVCVWRGAAQGKPAVGQGGKGRGRQFCLGCVCVCVCVCVPVRWNSEALSPCMHARVRDACTYSEVPSACMHAYV